MAGEAHWEMKGVNEHGRWISGQEGSLGDLVGVFERIPVSVGGTRRMGIVIGGQEGVN